MTRLKVVALATLALTLTAIKPAAAALFSKADLDPSKLILVASPYGNNAHQLVIVEQVSNSRACWSESGSSPTTVEPLLTNFDFTGICGRSTDANGYSIRMGDQDLGLQYSLRVVQRDGDLLLLGVPTIARNAPEIQIGRAGGVTNGFAKLSLNPGWRLTRRVYNNQPLGHFYLTNDQPLNSAIATAPTPLPATRLPMTPLPSTTVSRPEIVLTPGSNTPSLFPKPISTSIPILVPSPESIAATSSTLPLPASRPANANTPAIAVPVKAPVATKKPTPQTRTTASRSSSTQSPSKGKPIRLPVPAAATRSLPSAPSDAMQPPAMPSPLMQPLIQPPAIPLQAAPATPRIVKPGDFVVPTTTF